MQVNGGFHSIEKSHVININNTYMTTHTQTHTHTHTQNHIHTHGNGPKERQKELKLERETTCIIQNKFKSSHVFRILKKRYI